MGSHRLVGVAACALLLAPGPVDYGSAGDSTLAVRRSGAWVEWWRADRAPRRWGAPLPTVERNVTWRPGVPGVEWGELVLAGSGEAWRVRVIVARLDPARVAIRLAANVSSGGAAAPWTVDDAPADAVLALNAGQFTDEGPWGWVVHRGREFGAPGVGPLSMAVATDSLGKVHWIPADSIAAARASGRAVEALQSYPALLVGDGELPVQLRAAGRGVDLAHRDSRLAIGELRDGRLLIALTRFEGLGGALSALPFGPTVPEMAAIMGALGARRAMMLDGGLSSQLLLRDQPGHVNNWRGLRAVPLGIVAVPR